MLIFPAIDLRGGQVVRLSEGDYGRMTVYASDPLEIARRFRAAGAACLHVVDLDGAKDGTQENLPVIAAIVREGGLFVEVGGGGRSEESVGRYMDLGVDRVIVGTMAVENPALMEKLAAKYPGRLAAGVDTVIYTDISRDGMLGGTNLAVYERLSQVPGLKVVASGGISFEREIAALRGMNLYAAILGKALYTGKLSLPRALAIARGEEAPQ